MSGYQALQDPLAFPGFLSCPAEEDIDLQYYSSGDGYYFKPSRHWCLLAEIVDAVHFLRLRLNVRDRLGHVFPINFHLEGSEEPKVEQYITGHTIAILYPHQHGFLDMSTGIRQESMQSIQVSHH